MPSGQAKTGICASDPIADLRKFYGRGFSLGGKLLPDLITSIPPDVQMITEQVCAGEITM